jgi:hypothetical protein
VLQCEETNVTNLVTFRQDDFEIDSHQPASHQARRSLKNVINVLELSTEIKSLSLKLLKAEDLLAYSPCNQMFSDMDDSASKETKFRDVNVLLPMRSLECSVFTTRYDVHFSFANGVQNIVYSTSAKQPYAPPLHWYSGPSGEFRPFQSLADYFQTSALIDAFLSQLYFQGMGIHTIPTVPSLKKPEVKTIRLLNGSEITLEMCKKDLPNCSGGSKYDLLRLFHQEISFHALMC